MDVCRFEVNAPAIVAESIDGEVIVMNLPQGIYYSLTGSAALAWLPLVNGASVAEVAGDIARRHDVAMATVARDCAAFLQELLAESIVRPVDAGRASADVVLSIPSIEARAALAEVTADGGRPTGYQPFGFERFDDMRAMLVIDPVHEVGDFGWPQAAGTKDR